MRRTLSTALTVLPILALAGLLAYFTMRPSGRTPEGYPLLTAIPGAESFVPKAFPSGPVLVNTARDDLAVGFGYKVGGVPYAYTLRLAFPDGTDKGQATVTTQQADHVRTVDVPTTRLWDAPRGAYVVAVEAAPDASVPALCIKTLIGPSNKGYDLSDASLCVAQRDGRGTCHPETLACGLIRQPS